MCQFYQLGTLSYREAWDLQKLVHGLQVAKSIPPTILLLEHLPVITLGKNAEEAALLISEKELHEQGIDLVRTDRGGQLTAHMPGQLVVYPILNLTEFRLGVREYIDILEQAVIATLSHFGVSAGRDAEYPGVWVGQKKICAVGVRVKQRVSLHGLALNLSNDLGLFDKIIPCGIQNRGVTNLQAQIDRVVSAEEVGQIFAGNLSARLKVDRYGWGDQTRLQEITRSMGREAVV